MKTWINDHLTLFHRTVFIKNEGILKKNLHYFSAYTADIIDLRLKRAADVVIQIR
jgi:hypothetical protein